MNDMEVLRRAYDRENDSRDRRPGYLRCWEYYTIGASREDVKRLIEAGFIIIHVKTSTLTKYRLSEKGRGFVAETLMEREHRRVPAADIKTAMNLVVGFEDIKGAIAQAIESRRRINFLLEGPPACAKSIMLEGVRSVVLDSYMAFGSRTSASGLSDALFEHQPSVLLLDEADKMHMDVYSVLLGLMESGEILETKSQKTRGIKLDTILIAACNSTKKMPQEFLSRFALHVRFPTYTREEFIEVCEGFLARAESCPKDLASLIGQCVYDYGIGDVRKARGVWMLMTAPTKEEVHRVVRLMVKYSPDGHKRPKSTQGSRMPGL
ncbi:MAG: ATP-binding protein [Deltaproteobacteria bacterium]|nr:ATP-binding protein [Deltaproteobacteria bacterium]